MILFSYLPPPALIIFRQIKNRDYQVKNHYKIDILKGIRLTILHVY